MYIQCITCSTYSSINKNIYVHIQAIDTCTCTCTMYVHVTRMYSCPVSTCNMYNRNSTMHIHVLQYIDMYMYGGKLYLWVWSHILTVQSAPQEANTFWWKGFHLRACTAMLWFWEGGRERGRWTHWEVTYSPALTPSVCTTFVWNTHLCDCLYIGKWRLSCTVWTAYIVSDCTYMYIRNARLS